MIFAVCLVANMQWLDLLKAYYPVLKQAGVMTVPKSGKHKGKGVIDMQKLEDLLAVGERDANYLVQQRQQGQPTVPYPMDNYGASLHPKES